MKVSKHILENKEEEFDVKQIVFQYVKYWYLFVISAVVFFSIAFFYVYKSTPLYRIEGSILIQDDKKNSSKDLFKELDVFGSKKVIENELEILKSKSLMNKAMRDLDFNVSYFWKGNVSKKELYKNSPFIVVYDSLEELDGTFDITILDANRFYIQDKTGFKGEFLFGESISSPIGIFHINKRIPNFDDYNFNKVLPKDKARNFIFMFNSFDNNVQHYLAKLQIEIAAKQSTVLRLSVEDPVPEKGVDLLNKLVEVYIKNGIDEKNKIASNTLNFIQERLKYIEQGLSDVELGIENFKTDRGITDIGSEAKLFLENVKDYDSDLNKVTIQLNLIKGIEDYLLDNQSKIHSVPSSIGIEDPIFQKLIQQLNELELQRSRFSGTTKKSNPVNFNLNIDGQIKQTKAALTENIDRIKENLTITELALKKMVGKYEGRIKSLPKASRELISIQRQQAIKENLYLYLLQKQEETAVTLASTVSDCRIIDSAESSQMPVKPVKKMIYLVVILISIATPALGITLVGFFNDKIMDLSEIELQTQAPILGIINHSKSNKSIVVNEKAKSAVAEQFRSIRTNLQYVAAGKDQKVILITSSMGGEGKTFISTNIASTIALTNKKVVVLEFDLRKPKLSLGLNLSNEFGLSNYLIGAKDLDSIIKPSGIIADLYVISSGPIPPNPTGLILSDRMNELIIQLKERFDYIIIDTPPVGLVTDGLILTQFVDLSLYVLRQNKTEKHQLKFVDDLYQSKKLKNLSIIFNGVNKGIGNYGYGYGYYEEELVKKNFLSRFLMNFGLKR